MRKAGELIAEFLKERTLANNRANPIGAGSYGVVYESDVPGNVIKQTHSADINNNLVQEANLQSVAADMGIAPRIAGIETFPVGIGNRVEMADVRNNFEPVAGEGDRFGQPGVGFPVDPKINIRTAQQLGQLALKGVRLEDRRAANIVQNKMTGRPMQLDFGIAGKVEGSEQVATLAMATAEGFEAAGLNDVASIYRATVMDLLEGGDVDDAMDIAKQGFSRLQKIK
jgi:predicted Ser/Thr protein kinase